MLKNPEAWLKSFELKVINDWAEKAGIDPIESENYFIDYYDKYATVFIYQPITEDDEKALKQACEKAFYGDWEVIIWVLEKESDRYV